MEESSLLKRSSGRGGGEGLSFLKESIRSNSAFKMGEGSKNEDLLGGRGEVSKEN